MQLKTIRKTITKKLEEWLDSIEDKDLAKDVKGNILVSGGSIASMLLSEPVNDYDIYIKDMDVLLRLVKYYTMGHSLEVFDGREKEKHKSELESEMNSGNNSFEFMNNAKAISIRNLHEDQIKIFTSGKKIDKNQPDQNPKPYLPSFFSPNAISLTGDIQIVNRFHGDSEQIHKTFDFIHATNYFTFEEGLVTNKEALESLITKRLKYQGSLYPLTSIIRANKFVKRGWNIGAGEYLKIMFQISELDLKDPDVLDEQLIGVDVAYFSTIIEILRGKFEKESDFTLTAQYLNTLIEKVFNE